MDININFVPAHPNNYSLQRVTPTFLVLHGTGGTFRGDQTWLQNPQAKVSYHYLISKEGTIVQMVKDFYVAFHAGVSEWSQEAARRRGFPFSEHSSWTNLNLHSIGIGLESLNRRDEIYPEPQLQALAELVRSRYNHIPRHRILTHEMISAPRKVDPVNFPFKRLLQLLASDDASESEEELEPAPVVDVVNADHGLIVLLDRSGREVARVALQEGDSVLYRARGQRHYIRPDPER